jgi:hypothetical protein
LSVFVGGFADICVCFEIRICNHCSVFGVVVISFCAEWK